MRSRLSRGVSSPQGEGGRGDKGIGGLNFPPQATSFHGPASFSHGFLPPRPPSSTHQRVIFVETSKRCDHNQNPAVCRVTKINYNEKTEKMTINLFFSFFIIVFIYFYFFTLLFVYSW